ncbi:glycine betaine ABC transporter substrate-binding protein OsmF [Methyloferula stellata]|uniref:glycine betaine ABC transporter substrate-binding protein OsmF n=1 Tax=Methyloferula stellata TaxID=876270 RepID=UPI0003819430|nr:ABC transporter substrate-binding protein [Methyloferula stellata]
MEAAFRTTRRSFLTGAAVCALVASARAETPIIVSSKLDIEGALLGRMILIALSRAGLPVENRLLLGPTAILRQALLSGAIDLYPEYTGNAAFFFNDDADPVWRNAKKGYERAASLDLARNHLVWLTPAPADNNWVIAMPRALAASLHLTSLADFARWVNADGPIKLAASAEFVESPAGLPAFEEAYGFKLNAMQLLVLSGGETSATCKAAADGISGVNAAMAYGTDGALIALDLIALDDDKHVQPVYAPAPVVRESTLAQYPQIAPLLAPVFAGLDLSTLRRLNAKIAVDGQEAAKVAETYLESQGLLK